MTFLSSMQYNIRVTGFQYREIDALKCDPTGQFVQLKHEPMEKYPNAVSVYFNNKCIGYLPEPKDERDTARDEILNYIKEGREIHAIAVSCAWVPETELWNPKHWKDNPYYIGDIIVDEQTGEGDVCEIDAVLHRCSLKITVGGQHNTEEGRYYVKDGKKYRSISDVVKELIPQEGVQWDEKSLNIAARYGNIIHKIAEHDFMEYSIMDDHLSIVQKAVSDALETTRWYPLLSETQVFDNELLIAGTFDACARVDNEYNGFDIAIIDWKSSRSASQKHKTQVAFYAKNTGAKMAFVICFGSDNKKGYSVCNVDIDKEYENLKKLYKQKYV